MTDEFNNKTVTNQDSEISTLLSGLRRVEAPGDFDFRVRARIAQGRSAERTGSWMPVWVKAAAPLALVLAIGGYLMSGGFASPVEVPAVASFQEPVVVAPVEVQPVPVVESPVIAQTLPDSSAPSRVSPPPAERITPAITRKSEKPAGGSYDAAARDTTVVPQRDPAVNKTGATGSSLSSMGIQTLGGTVTGVTSGSRAAASGVRVGDVIESSNGSNLRIRRDGKTTLIVIN